MTISSSTPFEFDSAQFATWAGGDAFQGYSTSSVTVTGYYLGNLVGSDTLTVGVSFATLASTFASSRVDTLVITNDGQDGHWWLGDNLTVNASTVPEPSTWALMLLGFAGLGFAGYRKSRKAVSIAA